MIVSLYLETHTLSISRSLHGEPWKGSEWELFTTICCSRAGHVGYCSHHLPTTYKDNAATFLLFTTIVKLKSYLYFSASHNFIFICIPRHSATTRDLDSSTKEVYIGQRGPANLRYGKGLIREGHLKRLPSHRPHWDMRIIHTFLRTPEARRKDGKKKFVNWAGRTVLT